MAYDRKYRSNNDLETTMQEYFDSVDSRTETYETKNGMKYRSFPYTVQGLCDHLDIADTTLEDYEKMDKYGDFNRIVKKAKNKIAIRWIELGAVRDLEPSVVKMILAKHYGYSDKQETVTITKEELSVDNLKEQFKNMSDDEFINAMQKMVKGGKE